MSNLIYHHVGKDREGINFVKLRGLVRKLEICRLGLRIVVQIVEQGHIGKIEIRKVAANFLITPIYTALCKSTPLLGSSSKCQVEY